MTFIILFQIADLDMPRSIGFWNKDNAYSEVFLVYILFARKNNENLVNKEIRGKWKLREEKLTHSGLPRFLQSRLREIIRDRNPVS